MFTPRSFGKVGDEAEVTIELDQAPREAEVPEALAAALAADPQAAASFERMAFTHRREYARWIAEAKRAETRQRRVAQAVEMIRVEKLAPDRALPPIGGSPASRTRSGSPAGIPRPRRATRSGALACLSAEPEIRERDGKGQGELARVGRQWR